ncbi:MAG: zinc-ribbon domain-containing protein [Roseinatronobacter sp.]
MRLVCTECNAQYEIDAALLPDSGREVQCSACGHVWFQEKTPAVAAAAPAPEDMPKPTADAPLAEAAPTPRKVDDKVLEILREEAEFESRQRAREAEALETQPDLGLSGAAPWPSGAKHIAPAPPKDAPDATPKANTQAAFPDIEDISASLEPISQSRAGRSTTEFDLPATANERRRSFWGGLAVPLVLAAILIAPYLMASEIITALPASEPAMTGYVNTVDGMRIRLAALLNG